MSTRRVLAPVVSVVGALALGLAAGLAGSARATPAASTFADPSGDGGGAPDVTTVAITDDYSTGAIQFSVTAAGYSTIDVSQSPSIFVYLDTDRNSAASRESDGNWWNVVHYDGSNWVDVPQSPTMSVSRSGDTYTWNLSKSDLGGTTGFAFWVIAGTFDSGGNVVAGDRAPDGGTWSYMLSIPPPPPAPAPVAPAGAVKPVIGAPTITPAATAGKHVTVTFPVTRSDNGEPLTTGRMICDPSVQGTVITHAESFTGGTAKLSFTIPKTAKGKLLKVKVTIKVGGKSTTKVATFKVH